MTDKRFINSARACALLSIVAAIGCSKVFLQDDGFSEKLRGGCATEEECRRLQLEAEQRIIKCKDNVVGYVRCDDARADKLMADSFVHKYDEARKQRVDDDRKSEANQRRLDAQREHDARERQRDEERRASERQRIAFVLERETRINETCTASEPARIARRRHADILQNQAPAATVRKQCTPRTETHSVQGECKDANGFTRSCTKTVAGDVVGYACPKTMDQEVVQLGLYQLELLDGYPFPEDHAIRVSDAECVRAKQTAEELKKKLDALTPTKPSSNAPSSAELLQ